MVCDGFPDCPDGEDENDRLVDQGLVETRSCDPLDDFTCKNGECTDFVNKCDGKVDCSDESDESDCPEDDVTTNEPEVGIDDPTSDYDYDPGYFDPNAGAVVTPNDTSVNYDYYLPDDYEEREYDNWYN